MNEIRNKPTESQLSTFVLILKKLMEVKVSTTVTQLNESHAKFFSIETPL